MGYGPWSLQVLSYQLQQHESQWVLCTCRKPPRSMVSNSTVQRKMKPPCNASGCCIVWATDYWGNLNPAAVLRILVPTPLEPPLTCSKSGPEVVTGIISEHACNPHGYFERYASRHCTVWSFFNSDCCPCETFKSAQEPAAALDVNTPGNCDGIRILRPCSMAQPSTRDLSERVLQMQLASASRSSSYPGARFRVVCAVNWDVNVYELCFYPPQPEETQPLSCLRSRWVCFLSSCISLCNETAWIEPMPVTACASTG